MSETAAAGRDAFRSVVCSRGCFREVLVRVGDDRPAICEFCHDEAVASLGEVIRARKAEREKLVAKKDQELALRLARIRLNAGNRAYKPGDKTGAVCPACRRSYIYDLQMRQVHDGECPGHAGGGSSPRAASALPAVQRTFVGYEDDD